MPLPVTGPERGGPHGHDGTTPGLLSAQLRITVTARAPLLVRGFGSDDAPRLPDRPDPAGPGRVAMIPGSGLHGAVRSLHEALTGSCLRVVDDVSVPFYRQQADGKQVSKLRLAIVTAATAPASADEPQRPPTVRLCEPGEPLRHRLGMGLLTQLHQQLAPRGGLRSGDRLDVTVPADEKVPLEASPNPEGRWVVFISHGAARKEWHTYKAAVRELTADHRTIPGTAWTEFLDIVKTADDLRRERLCQQPEGERWAEVEFTHKPKGGRETKHKVGMRSLARETVHVGQPLWVMLDDDGEITQVGLAQIWREKGTIPVARRIGDYGPCRDPKDLCPSCRLFGSADVSGKAVGPTEQRSYRGHVRFSDAVATAAVTPTKDVRLPPLGQPNPGSGQFYLENPTEVIGNASRGEPLRQWGSSADRRDGGPRRIRGRKFYWHTVPQQGRLPARGEARPAQVGGPMSAPAVLFPAGTTFTATITAVDVDRGQLGALLAAFDSSDVLGQADALVHLGGGRPLGYGSCRIDLDEDASRVWVSAARYGAAVTPTTAELLVESRAEFAGTAGRQGWAELAKVLSAAAVAGQNVWYPPGEGRRNDEKYDTGFEFWKQSSGKQLAADEKRPKVRKGYPLTVLPLASAPVQALPIVPKAESVDLPTQQPVT